jgi:hypothetical protein
MEQRHILWNSATGQTTAWTVHDGEITGIVSEPSKLTLDQIETIAQDAGAELEII